MDDRAASTLIRALVADALNQLKNEICDFLHKRLSAIPENREFKKKISFFLSKTCIVESLDICVVSFRVTNFCQNWSTCYCFLRGKLNFHLSNSPIFGNCHVILITNGVAVTLHFGVSTCIHESRSKKRQKRFQFCLSVCC